MSQYAMQAGNGWKLVTRPRWFDDDGAPVSDTVLVSQGVYPAAFVVPAYDQKLQKIERLPSDQWTVVNDTVQILHQPVNKTPEERKFEELTRRTDPEKLLAALELVADLVIKPALENMDDPDKATALFPELKPGMVFTQGDIDAVVVVAWEGKLHKVLQPHTTQANWTPENSPSLYTPFRNPSAGPQPWVQLTSAETSYSTGEEVTHDNPNDGGAIWVYSSNINANTTEPGRDGTFDRWWAPVRKIRGMRNGIT